MHPWLGQAVDSSCEFLFLLIRDVRGGFGGHFGFGMIVDRVLGLLGRC